MGKNIPRKYPTGKGGVNGSMPPRKKGNNNINRPKKTVSSDSVPRQQKYKSAGSSLSQAPVHSGKKRREKPVTKPAAAENKSSKATQQSTKPAAPSGRSISGKRRRAEYKNKRLDLENTEQREKRAKADAESEAESVLTRPEKESKDYIKPLAPAKAPQSEQRRKLKRILFYAVSILVLVSVCCILSLTVFFKIDAIEVEGKTRYTADSIVAACMIDLGDNLILCRTSPGEKNIEKSFPYVEKASIHKKLFNKIVISIEEAEPTSIVESGGKYYVLSQSGKIIEIDDEKKYNVPTVLGARLKDAKLSSVITFKDVNIQKYIDSIIASLKENNIKNIVITMRKMVGK